MSSVMFCSGFVSSLRTLREERSCLEVGAQLGGILYHVLSVSIDIGLRTVENLGVFENEICIVLKCG